MCVLLRVLISNYFHTQSDVQYLIVCYYTGSTWYGYGLGIQAAGYQAALFVALTLHKHVAS